LVSITGTVIGFLLLGFAEPIGKGLASWFGGAGSVSQVNIFVISILFLSRIIDGLTGGNISVAQAYITDVTDEKNRARGLGMIGAAFGLGFIIGPAMGGLLSTWGYSVPAFVAAGLAFLNLLAVTAYLPESLTEEARMRNASRTRPGFTVNALWKALNRPRVGPLLHVRFFYGLAFATFQTIFPLYAQVRLGLDAQRTGFVLAYVGILSVLVQGIGIGILAKRFKDTNLIMVGTVLMMLALAAWAFTANTWLLLFVLIPIAFAGGTLNTVLSSALTKAVLPEEIGGTLGLAASVESFTRVIAPSAGGWLLGQLGAWAPGIFSALIMGWVVTFAWRRLVINPDPPLSTKETTLLQMS
jgi:DHA1 family tetracycline resistance protein-like MFS transporter